MAAAATLSMPHDAERQRLLAVSMRVGMAGMLAAIPLGAYWLIRANAQYWAAIWAIAACLSTLSSIPLATRLLRSRHDAARARHTEHLYTLKMLLTGGLWGSLALWREASDVDLLALGMLQFLILVVSGVVLSMSRFAFPVLLLSITLPLSLRLIVIPPDALPPAAAGVLIAALVLGVAHQLLYRTVHRVLLRRRLRDALAQEQEALFHAASEGILLVRGEKITKCNWQGAAMFDSTPEAIIGTAIADWLHEPEGWSQYLEDMQSAFYVGERYGCIARLRRASGELFFAELSANPIHTEQPDAGIVLVATDISVRLATEAALRTSEQRFRRLLSLSSDWYWEQDEYFRFTQVKGTRSDVPNDPEQYFLGKQRWELDIVGVDERRWDAHRATLDAHLPFTDFVYQLRARNGEMRWMSVTGHPLYDETGRFCGYHGIGTDITENMRRQERYHHLAHHDTLTGLPNRRLLLDRLDQASAHSRRGQHHVALMMLDLDDFKIINDTDGHEAGDQVLISVAERLRSVIRETDTLCRLGGDEFVILLPEISSTDDADQVARKVIATLTVPFDIEGKNYKVGVSVGIALYPDHTLDPDKLFTLADAAMYHAKQTGGNHHSFAQPGDQGLLQFEAPT